MGLERGEHRCLVLRRFDGELLEFLSRDSEAATGHPRPPWIDGSEKDLFEVLVDIENDTRIFYLTVPSTLVVQPVDWRRFAYDHAKVLELISACVVDNLRRFVFQSISEDVISDSQEMLRIALFDLSSVFTTTAVNCSSIEKGVLQVTVEGEHKNGTKASFQTAVKL